MSVKLMTEHHLEFLSLKRGCTGSSESTLVKMPHCLKSCVAAQFSPLQMRGLINTFSVLVCWKWCFINMTHEGKKEELIQSSTTPDLGHHTGMWKKSQENATHKRAKEPALSQQVTTRLQRIDKTVWQRKIRNTNNNKVPQKQHRLGSCAWLIF